MITSNGLWLERDSQKICYNPWTHFEVNNPNGDVSMCCDRSIKLGNVNEQGIEEIWNGEAYRRARRQMWELGGERWCTPNCVLLNGLKDNQSFSWYPELEPGSAAHENALLNEQEIRVGKDILESRPRWLRFSLSYACNFNCYHCYQEGDRERLLRLDDSFLENVAALAEYTQFIFIFGGEPAILPEFPRLLSLGEGHPHVRFGTVTNASRIDRHIDSVRRVNWQFIGVSLDAATQETYARLREGKEWERTMANVGDLAVLSKEKGFLLNLSMTVNTQNCHEIYPFVELAASFGAAPIFTLVTNAGGTPEFYRDYLAFDKAQLARMTEDIARVARDFSYTSRETGLYMAVQRARTMHEAKSA